MYNETPKKIRRNPMKQETKDKIREAMLKIGHLPPSQKGLTRSAEVKHKISIANKGYKHTEVVRQKMSIDRKGAGNSFSGKSHSDISKRQMSNARKGRFTGENSWNWIKDRNQVIEKHRIRGTQEWKTWRGSVFRRDNYTCQECHQSGVYLEPHHIEPIREGFNKLSDLENGITLCRPCHQKTIWKESSYAAKYKAIVAAHGN
jgi:5-methylcytosine-specific restriction endonuclease McrA